ncbi:MAG: hypothetical protein IJR70_04210 [Eubacterium sp.]|nr:hypothetical protein [Eubacterium sp.]
MAQQKHSDTGFIIYKHWDEQIALLSLEQKGLLFEAILNYQCREQDFETDDMLLKMLWSVIKQSFELNNKKYEERCIKNRENAIKRWNKTDKSQSDSITDNAFECDGMRSDAIDADIEIKKEKDKEKETNIVIEKEKDDNSLKKPDYFEKYDFSSFSEYELTSIAHGYYASNANFTLAEEAMLQKIINPDYILNYFYKASILKPLDRFETVIQWAKNDGNYCGEEYEIKRH